MSEIIEVMLERVYFGEEFESVLEPWFTRAKQNGKEKLFRNQVNDVCLSIRYREFPSPYWNDNQRKLYSILLAAKRTKI